jgi:hypothetical protein
MLPIYLWYISLAWKYNIDCRTSMKPFPLEILNKFFQRKKRIFALATAFAGLLPLASAYLPQARADSDGNVNVASNPDKIQVCRNGQITAIDDEEKLFFDTAPPCRDTGDLYSFTDEFERNNSEQLGPEWLDCHTQKPASFEPLGILNGGVVVPDPFTRPGVYDTTPPSGHPPTNGRLYPGIGCAFVDTGTTTVSVKVIWSGHHGVEHDPPISHVEATPLLYVSPGSPKFGFGAWTSELYGAPVMLLGYVGSPVEKFESVAYARLADGHVSGTPREVELRAEEAGKVTVWVDGKQVSLEPGIGFEPIVIDSSLINSTNHGFAVDAHLVDPPTSIPTIKSIEAISIKELN